MIRFLVIGLFFQQLLFGVQTSDKIFECTKIFKERKSELLVELERIDEQKQSLNALKTATETLLKEKEKKLAVDENRVNEKLDEIAKKEASVKKMLAENKKVLADIKATKMSNIAQTFAKMKPAAAASILADMKNGEAVSILQALKPKVVGKILAKMDPQKASSITILLTK
jgi:flagellar motility protein MotE (MotC chaperone)